MPYYKDGSSVDEMLTAARRRRQERRARRGSGAVTASRKKRPFSSKVAGLVFQDDIDNVAEHIGKDILWPALVNTFIDSVNDALHMMLLGGTSKRQVTKNPYFNSVNDGAVIKRKQPSFQNRNYHNFEDIVYPTRDAAASVLSELQDVLEQDHWVDVASFYDASGMEWNWQDEKWGWTNLVGVEPKPIRGGGWVLNMPKTSYIGE